LNLEVFDCPLREWMATERPRKEIKRRLKHFLTSFRDDKGKLVHQEKIESMCAANQQVCVGPHQISLCGVRLLSAALLLPACCLLPAALRVFVACFCCALHVR
jgi:hypothetical protein